MKKISTPNTAGLVCHYSHYLICVITLDNRFIGFSFTSRENCLLPYTYIAVLRNKGLTNTDLTGLTSSITQFLGWSNENIELNMPKSLTSSCTDSKLRFSDFQALQFDLDILLGISIHIHINKNVCNAIDFEEYSSSSIEIPTQYFIGICTHKKPAHRRSHDENKVGANDHQ